jgi:hypothetical protein
MDDYNRLHDINPDQWRRSIQQYDQERKNLQWGHNVKPLTITHKIIKDKENILNPISQNYYDEGYNQFLHKSENQATKNILARSYDKAIRTEQTYDLINLKDKLVGFEKHADHPKVKESKQKKREDSNTNFNILSNITLDKHHFNPPELRPIIKEDTKELKNVINVLNYKDYDIISNKYKFDHEAKLKVDQEISKLHAAQNYWKSNDYDLIKIKFIDDDKEQKFMTDREYNTNKFVSNGLGKRKEYYFNFYQ